MPNMLSTYGIIVGLVETNSLATQNILISTQNTTWQSNRHILLTNMIAREPSFPSIEAPNSRSKVESGPNYLPKLCG